MAGRRVVRGYVSRFELYNGAIRAHFVGPTGLVAKHANRINAEAARRAEIIAPKRTGHLSRSIVKGTNPVGNLRYGITLTATAHYAPFVLRGTHSPITPFYGRWLKVPTTRMGGKYTLRQYVRGQRANNFLGRAMHGALGWGAVELLP